METLQPKYRFPEFKGNWGKKKLSEVSKIGRGKSKHRPRDADFLYGGKFPFIQTGDIRNADLYLTNYTQTYSDAGLKQSKLWDVNTLCITIAANIAETTILKIKACFPDSIIGLIPFENEAIVLFVKYQFDKFKIEIQNLSQGVAQANLNQEKLSNIEFNFPSLEEQTRIANFLSSVDEKLNLLKEKKSLLENYKKGIMQKIFNQELRFTDDKGNDFENWEVKSLGELCDYKNGGSFEKYVCDDGIYNLISLNSIDINGKIKNSHKKVSVTDNSLQKGDLIMVLSDVAHGNFLGLTDIVPDDNFVLNQRMGALKPVLNFNSFYLKTFINYNQSYFKLMGKGSSQQNLSKGDIENFIVKLPCKEEQAKIANFLSAIDEKIVLVSNQIQDTLEYKRGLLQQMFV